MTRTGEILGKVGILIFFYAILGTDVWWSKDILLPMDREVAGHEVTSRSILITTKGGGSYRYRILAEDTNGYEYTLLCYGRSASEVDGTLTVLYNSKLGVATSQRCREGKLLFLIGIGILFIVITYVVARM